MPFVLGSISPYNQSYLIYFYSVGPFSALSLTQRRDVTSGKFPCISRAIAVTADRVHLPYSTLKARRQ